MDLKRAALSISGRVQGVGFRYFTLLAAERLGVSGWVRNEPDGSVRCEAQGESSAIDRFLDELRRGPTHGRVDEIVEEVLRPDPTGMKGFRIR